MKALETNFNDTKIIDILKNGEFTAPTHIHNTIEQEILTLATLCTPIDFIIQEEAFRVIAHNEYPNLINIGRRYKCQIEIQENIEQLIRVIPEAAAQDHVSNQLTAAAIKIHQDDLANQKVIIARYNKKI